MAEETYEGWTNRETWLVALWLNNEQGLQEEAMAVCKTDGEMLQEAAQSLEDWVRDLPEIGATHGFAIDLLNAALARCDWREIAATFREEQ
jgi:hypothetical protein